MVIGVVNTLQSFGCYFENDPKFETYLLGAKDTNIKDMIILFYSIFYYILKCFVNDLCIAPMALKTTLKNDPKCEICFHGAELQISRLWLP